MFSECVELFESSLASTYPTRDTEIMLVSMKELKMLEVVGGRTDMMIMSSLKWTEWAYQSHLQWREKVTLSAFYSTLYGFASHTCTYCHVCYT